MTLLKVDQRDGDGYVMEATNPEIPAPTPDIAGGRYQDSNEHLWDELERIDQLVRAQTLRWQLTVGANKPENLWGMIHVTELEVSAYLNSPFIPPDRLPDELSSALNPFWQGADALAQAIQARREKTPSAVRLRLDRLRTLFELSDLERDILLVCLLPELDARYRRLYGYLQDDASRTRPSVELVLQILYPTMRQPGASRAAFETGSRLLAHHLLVVEGPPQSDAALSMRSVRLDDRVVNYLLGHDRADSRLTEVITESREPLTWDQLVVEEAQLERLETLADWWQGRWQTGPRATVFLYGPYGGGRLAAARAMCARLGEIPLLVADVAKALQAPEGWARMVDLSYREATLRDAALYWAGCEALLERDQPPHPWDYLVAGAERHRGLTFLASQTAWDPAGRFQDRLFLRLEFPVPGYQLRRQVWLKHLPPRALFVQPAPDRTLLAEALANGFQFTEGQILDAFATAWGQVTQRSPGRPRMTVDDLYLGCRRQSGRRLMTMARRVEIRTELTFDDLILPAPNKRQLEEVRLRIRHRSRVYTGLGFEKRVSLGKGLIALFTGSSGTGKTMAAELLAQEQQVDLYKVDLSAVVSKYVGETEKNLSQVFAEAEDANAIIFFDEADALFGKRGEVKEARDRWANIEVNFLLQRVEEYAGVVVMATNLQQNIDEAFQRRIHVIVDFPFPDADARCRIWTGLFPAGLDRPPEDEIRALAERFSLAGGSLKNIVIDAAFRALAASGHGTPAITVRHLVASTAREYQKLGKPITKGEFGETFYAWVEEDILA
jgi:AAA+ superfamily predicted ATPase